MSLPSGGGEPHRLLLVLPDGYMNESGRGVRALTRYVGTEADHVIVVHDELDLPFGAVRAKFGGGEGGHNGLRSVSAHLGTRDYLRVRIGIGRPPGRRDPAEFVLTSFSAAERPDVPWAIDRAADVVESIAEVGLEQTQQRFHSPP